MVFDLLQVLVGTLYLAGALGAMGHRPHLQRLAVAAALAGLLGHLGLLLLRWQQMGQLPIVTRYEDLTVDALAMAGIYLLAQWRYPPVRRGGALALLLAGITVLAALSFSRGAYPISPALNSPWLLVHAQANSLAIGTAVLAASLALRWSPELEGLLGRLLCWTLFLWSAMVVVGGYWASLAWGRLWGWDPIESWALGTLLVYALVLHLRQRPAWLGARGALVSLIPFWLMLFTTYGLLLVRHSIHGQYLFQ